MNGNEGGVVNSTAINPQSSAREKGRHPVESPWEGSDR